MLGSLLQPDIANWFENCWTHSGYNLGVSKGTTSLVVWTEGETMRP